MGTIETRNGPIGVLEAAPDPDRSTDTGLIPLLLLHGVGSDKSVWAPQIFHFGTERRTVALDYPGYGESALVADATRDDFAAAVLAAMDALEIARAHVCGLSLGGVVAIALHHLAPERCASLILADSFACHPEGAEIHARSLAGMRDLGMRGLAEGRVDALLGPEATADIRSVVVETMAAIDPAAYEIGATAVWLADQRVRVRKIRCPVLILCGSADRITPPALSDDLKDRIPHAALVEIAGAGHLSNLEAPVVFNRVVEAFLSDTERNL